MSRIFNVSVASVYPHYVTKVTKKGRSQAELDDLLGWLTGRLPRSTVSGAEHVSIGSTR